MKRSGPEKSILEEEASVLGEIEKTAHSLILAAKNDNEGDNEGKTAIHFAAMVGSNPDVFNYLITDHKLSLSAEDRNGRTAMHYAALYGHQLVIEYLFGKSNLLLTKKDIYGNTPLHLAAEHGCNSAVGLLINKGASAGEYNNGKNTPLDMAPHRGHLKTSDMLLLNLPELRSGRWEKLWQPLEKTITLARIFSEYQRQSNLPIPSDLVQKIAGFVWAYENADLFRAYEEEEKNIALLNLNYPSHTPFKWAYEACENNKNHYTKCSGSFYNRYRKIEEERQEKEDGQTKKGVPLLK